MQPENIPLLSLLVHGAPACILIIAHAFAGINTYQHAVHEIPIP